MPLPINIRTHILNELCNTGFLVDFIHGWVGLGARKIDEVEIYQVLSNDLLQYVNTFTREGNGFYINIFVPTEVDF